MIYSIIKVKMVQNASGDYYYTTNKQQEIRLLSDFIDRRYAEIERKKIVVRDPLMEKAIEEAEVGSRQEYIWMRQYFKRQKDYKIHLSIETEE